MIKKLLLMGLMSLLLAGCATGYHSFGYAGGYWDAKGPGKLTRVGFAANGYSKTDTVAVYLLYRCAELAKQQDKPYFLLYETIGLAISGVPTEVAYAPTSYGKPDGMVFVMFTNEKAPGALSTQEILDKYAAQVKGVKK